MALSIHVQVAALNFTLAAENKDDVNGKPNGEWLLSASPIGRVPYSGGSGFDSSREFA